MKHVHYLGLIVPSEGGTPEFLGPFLTHPDAKAAVQEEMGQTPGVVGGVVPFDFVEPAAAPAPAAAEPAAAPEQAASTVAETK